MDEKPSLGGGIGFTDEIQAKLEKKLGPEYISKRIGFGSSRVAYIEGWRAINLANQIFGYHGWSTEVKAVTVDFLDERQGRFSIGCTAIVRVSLSNGAYREDIGYGTVENEKRKSAAFERAKKSAVTDAMKRSLRGFGNALGNCLYDKSFLAKIDKVKFDPPDFDESDLFRATDEKPDITRTNTLDVQESLNTNKRRQTARVGDNQVNAEILRPHASVQRLKSEQDSPSLAYNNDQNRNQNQNQVQNQSAPQDHQEELLEDSLMFSDDFQDDDLINMGVEGKQTSNSRVIDSHNHGNNNKFADDKSLETLTFVSARVATSLQTKGQVSAEGLFDPKFNSQSIKHTVDQTTSKPIPVSVVGDRQARDTVYEKFAPKGKQINGNSPTQNSTASSSPKSTNFNSTENMLPALNGSVSTSTGIVEELPKQQPHRFAPPNSVVHPNSSVATSFNSTIPTRKEVGKPKILANRPTRPI